MSGIAGIIHFDGRPVVAGQIEAMTDRIAFRGPDGIAHWRDRDVALGHLMLHTTPEALIERQPLTNEDGNLVLVMDGRVDNWEELRRVLLGHGVILRDRSDAELVLRAFELWRQDALGRIDGDFALAVWDVRHRELFCARDRLGNKPFHYHWNGATFCFASDLAPLLVLPWVRREANQGMLAEFLAAQWYSRDETLWQGIYRLVAAHQMFVTASGTRISEWWKPDPFAKPPAPDEDGCIEAYRALLIEQVRRASRSHRAVTCEVSGGLDSSAILAVAERLRRDGRLLAPGLANYSIVFPGDPEADEVAYVRALGSHLDIPITEIAPSVFPLDEYRRRAKLSEDFPGAPNVLMTDQARSRVVSSGGRVVLTGEGGDDWLQGSRLSYAESIGSGQWRSLWVDWRAEAAMIGRRCAFRSLCKNGILPFMPSDMQRMVRVAVRRLTRRGIDRENWLAPAMQSALSKRQHDPIYRDLCRPGQKALFETLHDPFNALAGEQLERACAMAGVEPRHPMHASAMVELAFALPERMRFRQSRPKFMHAKAMEGYIPPAILNREDKADFSTMFMRTLAAEGELFDGSLARRRSQWLSEDKLQRLWRQRLEASPSGVRVWPLWTAVACDILMALTAPCPSDPCRQR